jgi:hypothetical protein
MSPLRRLFGPSRAEIWRQLSDAVGGTYERRWTGDKVHARHGEWTVTLDTYTVSTGAPGKGGTVITYTRMRAPFVNPEGFRFTISRKGCFSGVAAWLGAQDIEIGDPAFDDQFVIKGTHESRVRSLFANPRLRALVAAQPRIHLTVKDDEGWFDADFPDGVDELYFAVPGVIKDPDRLKALYDLFAETLDQLVEIGSAHDRDPGVKL